MNIRLLVGAALLPLAVASAARTNLLINGGLEPVAGTHPNQYNLITLSPGSSKLTGWSITSGTVDVVPGAATGSPYWENTQGNYSVDLVGTPGIGGISQLVTTAASTDYTLTFDLAFNPEVGYFLDESGDTKILRVQAIAGTNGAVLATQDFSGIGTGTFSSMGWTGQTLSFTATGTSVTLKFSALTPLNLPSGATASKIYCGPVIDNLDLEPSGGGGPSTPEPASLGLFATGATALLMRRRHKAV